MGGGRELRLLFGCGQIAQSDAGEVAELAAAWKMERALSRRSFNSRDGVHIRGSVAVTTGWHDGGLACGGLLGEGCSNRVA